MQDPTSKAHVFPFLAAVAVLALAAPPASGQAGDTASPDSLMERAREAQKDFELYRASRIPVERDEGRGSCDVPIGRFCVWYGGEGEALFPPEPPETERARRGLLGVLIEAREQTRDFWLTGQLVHYLVEQGDPRYAERVARECGIPEAWWCSALLGYSMHIRGEHVGAEAAFREALAAMPEDERRWWTTPRWVLSPEALDELAELDPTERGRRIERLWRLSDPLFMVEGNDRFTDHMARLVQVKNFEDAGNPRGMDWDVDIEEMLVRYGRTVGYSRTHNPRMSPPGAPMQLVDTRRLIGHHHPNSRGYLFPEAFLESPSDVPPESWITAPREARTWYAPPYAPDMRGLETQVGRFRRGDDMFVVGAYRPDPRAAGGDGMGIAENPFTAVGDVEAALFLLPEDGGEPVETWGDEAEGVFTLRAPPGRWVSSVEVLDSVQRRAWRARQGVRQLPLEPGMVDISDLLILKEGAPFPTTLDEAVPHVRPSIRVGSGERFTLVWEVYGLRVQEPVRVTVGFTRGRPGFLERVGEFLGIVEGDRAVEITFTEEAPDQVQAVFRAMEIEVPDVEPGEYTLHVRLDLTGRQPVIASRPIVVE